MSAPPLSKHELAQKIDHTLLKPTLLLSELQQTCQEALTYQFKTVCIPPSFVCETSQFLKGSNVSVITVVGFPLGYSLSESKALEAELAIEQGASEIDLVANLSFFKNQRYLETEADIRKVVQACHPIPLKVIIETAYLNTEEKVTLAKIAENAGALFVKTSTGFAHGGATLADVELLRSHLKPSTKIKASGGIRNLEMALQLIQAGADRLGTSAGVALLNGLPNEEVY